MSGGEDEDALALDPGFAARFEPQPRPPCQLYLLSPPTIEAMALPTGSPARLTRARSPPSSFGSRASPSTRSRAWPGRCNGSAPSAR